MLKRSLLALLLAGFAAFAHATTLEQFQAQTPEAQGHIVSSFVSALADKQLAENPKLSRAILDYFLNAPNDREPPPGMADLMMQMMAARRLAKEGKADLSKIQVEAMIVYVVRQHFKS